MRQPRTFTFHIFSANRVSGADSSDYVVNMPQLDALVNGQDRPDFYELWLDKIVGTAVGADNAPEAAAGTSGFIQLALDLPSPWLITNGKANVKFIAPISGSTMTLQTSEGRSNVSNPVLIAASGLQSTLHVQLFDQAGAALNVTGHDHVIVLTIREPYVGKA